MKYNLIVLSLLLILLSSFVNALNAPVGGVSYWNLSGLNDLWDSNDCVNNGGAVSSSSYPFFNLAGNSSPSSFSFTGTQYINCTNNANLDITGDEMALSVYFNASSTTGTHRIAGMPQDGGAAGSPKYQIFLESNVLKCIIKTSSGIGTVSTTFTDTTEWHNVICDYNSTNINLYVDGNLNSSVSQTGNIVSLIAGTFEIGRFSITYPQNFQGNIDEVSVYNRSLNSTEISQIYDFGRINVTEPTPINITINESIESSLDFQQTGTLNIGVAPSTVFSGDFNISKNDSKLYIGIVSQIFSIQNNTLFCEIKINGSVYGNLSRSNIGGDFGVSYATTTNISLDIGLYNLEYECARSFGIGAIQISNTDGSIHLQVDESNRSVNYEFNHIVSSISSSSFTELGNYFFTINDTNATEGVVQTLILDWDATYENTGGADGLFNSFININGTNCTNYPRNVNAGSVGSVGGDCMLVNITPSSVLNITLYGLGLNANFDFNIHSKNFYSHKNQTNNLDLTGIVLSSSSFVKLGNFTIEIDNNHAAADIFVKAGIPLNNTLVGADAQFFFNLSNSITFIESETYTRTVDESIGVSIIQHQFDTAPAGNYTVEFWGACSVPNCVIQGGEMVGYVTNTIPLTANSFNLSVFDNFDNSSISNFTVFFDNGNIFNTTSGSVEIFETGLINFTIFSIFNGGYFSSTILNHNSSNDLNTTLNQTLITWECIEKVSGINLNCSFPLENQTFNYNVIGNPHTQNLSVIGYFNNSESITVVALQNNTLNSTFASSNLSINSSSSVGAVTNCSYNVTGITYPSFSEITSGSPLANILLINSSYSVSANCTGFAIQSLNITINSTAQSLNFSLFTVNSISFQIFELSTLSLLLQNVNIEMIGSTVSFNLSTSNGTAFIDGLNDDTYKITFTSLNFDPTILFATISNNNHLDIDVFMKNGSSVDFIVQDQAGDFQGNATLTFTQNINGSFITIGQTKSDFSGRATIFLDETIEYTFFVTKDGFLTFTGQVLPTQPEYTVTIQALGTGRFISMFEDLKLDTNFLYTPFSGFAIADLILNSASGSLDYYGMNTTYDSINYFTNITTIPAGGIETFNISVSDATANPIIIINYWFKYDGHDLVEWNASYFINDIEVTNISITNGLFDDLENLDPFDPMRGIIGAIIIAALVLIFSGSGNLTITSIGGLIGLGVNWMFSLMPQSLLVVSATVIGILIIADNIGGGR